jgi:hypothetical protein
MFDHILLILLLLADVLCWYESRRSGNIMKLYFKERAAWYERRYRIQNAKTAESPSIPPEISVKVGGTRGSSTVERVMPKEMPVGQADTMINTKRPKKDSEFPCETEYLLPTETSTLAAEKPEKSS